MTNAEVDLNKLYYKAKILKKQKYINQEFDYIHEVSNEYDINPREIYGILILEHVNRGNWLNRIPEIIYVKAIYPLVPRDITIGIGQIRISTAKQYHTTLTSREIANKLLKKRYNIEIVAKIILNYNFLHQDNVKLRNKNLIKYYTTGEKDTEDNPAINMYVSLFDWLMEKSK